MADESDKIRTMMGFSPVTSSTKTGTVGKKLAKAPFGGVAGASVGSVSQVSGLTITGSQRSAAKEAEAQSIGYSKEYIASRGGINNQGYFNDTPISGQLTAEEQKRVTLPGGNTDTMAMARILQEKQIAELVKQGMSLSDATSKVSAQYGEYGVGGVTGGYDAQGNKVDGGQYDASGKLVTPASGTSGLGTSAGMTAGKVDSIAAISALLSSYGIGDLSGPLTEAVQKGYTSNTIQLIMQDPNSKDPLAVAFQTRFSANKVRAAAGKPVLSPAAYLAAERTYTEVMRSYGVSNLATKDALSGFISNDISATEVADRVGLAIDRVKNADPFTKAALAEYYPSLNQTDIVSALLNPAEGLPALKRKVQLAEIGGAAAIQGLKTGLTSTSELSKEYSNITTGGLGAEALASFGITQDQARKGYQTVASVAPRAEFLSSISGGEDYTRLQAEQEAFLGLASAKRARESLTAQEEGRFKGQSGLTKTTLTQKGAGQF
jgi:hypothetical protein